ncbi:hypothetical protein CEP54_014031 [Fusarium duplospermum]|uniref:Uncharacterized protein n=1 Tax=Fusarium duplospermum TaxID=1325734 RepID=A0A428NYU1_9HYPO|nr:hypothetical protein CEP54_014031 [Fusarium duplospermum]
MPLVTPASAHAYLSGREKETLYNLLERWATMRPSNGTTALSITTTKMEQVSVPIGKVNDHLPVTPMKRKKGQAEQLDPARARGAPAFLSVHLNVGTYDVGFLWRDGNFATINQKYVELDEDLTMKAAIRRAVLNYDQCEAARIEQYNKALVIALARLRILAFSKTGTQEIPSVSDAHRVNGRVKVVELASDQLLKISTDLGDIARDCVRLRVGQLTVDSNGEV